MKPGVVLNLLGAASESSVSLWCWFLLTTKGTAYTKVAQSKPS
jgi:hypothetical protein